MQTVLAGYELAEQPDKARAYLPCYWPHPPTALKRKCLLFKPAHLFQQLKKVKLFLKLSSNSIKKGKWRVDVTNIRFSPASIKKQGERGTMDPSAQNLTLVGVTQGRGRSTMVTGQWSLQIQCKYIHVQIQEQIQWSLVGSSPAISHRTICHYLPESATICQNLPHSAANIWEMPASMLHCYTLHLHSSSFNQAQFSNRKMFTNPHYIRNIPQTHLKNLMPLFRVKSFKVLP